MLILTNDYLGNEDKANQFMKSALSKNPIVAYNLMFLSAYLNIKNNTLE